MGDHLYQDHFSNDYPFMIVVVDFQKPRGVQPSHTIPLYTSSIRVRRPLLDLLAKIESCLHNPKELQILEGP